MRSLHPLIQKLIIIQDGDLFIYLILRKYLNSVNETDNLRRCFFDQVTVNLIPDDSDDELSELNIVKEIVTSLSKFDELCCWLQKYDPINAKMSKVRVYFEKLIAEFSDICRYLGKDSDLVHSPDFDCGIANIQLAVNQGKAFNVQLSISEKAAVSAYALDVDNSAELEYLPG